MILYCDYILYPKEIRFQKTNGGYSAPICAIVDSNVAATGGAAAGHGRYFT